MAKGLRLIRSRGEPRWVDWYVFAIGLCLCLLSRHVNLWLILLLPAAFLLSWALHRGLFSPRDRSISSRRRLRARLLGQAVIALAIGIGCVVVASSLTQRLARKTKLHPHSRIGYTFLWRLQFLRTLPPPARAALLQRVAARAHSKEARQLITLLGQMHRAGDRSRCRAVHRKSHSPALSSRNPGPLGKARCRAQPNGFRVSPAAYPRTFECRSGGLCRGVENVCERYLGLALRYHRLLLRAQGRDVRLRGAW